MATIKKSTKKKTKKKKTPTLPEGLSHAEVNAILSKLPPQLKKRLRKYW